MKKISELLYAAAMVAFLAFIVIPMALIIRMLPKEENG